MLLLSYHLEKGCDLMVIDLVHVATVGNIVKKNTTSTAVGDPIASNGVIAKELGVAIPSNDLTIEERGERVVSKLNPMMFEDRDYSAPNAAAFNKLYPEGDTTCNAIMKALEHSLTVDSDMILKSPVRTLEEFYNYIKFCMNKKIPVSKLGLCSWYGISRSTFDRYLNSDTPVSAILQNGLDYIAQIRTIHTDEGKIPVVQQIFEMANSHGYSRSDPKNNINIQINTGSYSPEEQMQIINDLDDF